MGCFSTLTASSLRYGLFPSFVTPEEDVEAWGEAVTLVAADIGEPVRSGFKFTWATPLWHEKDTV